ncbi:MAG: hypothetical protein KC468_34355, partial [Myxococcales bacterium]|nr:hypothetical protein [Myxococcales bacterium]
MREPERVGKDPEVERAAVEWIAALRERESMPETTRARLWERLEASIASDDADAETSGEETS